ncbi:MAG: hypothetical protein IJZ68_08625 [Bacteroidaceae bacterium]|nr:hypothetical protein [Bacteroidaceae bacterium]
MPFQGFLYAGDVYLGLISANTMPAMKREASRLCNQHFAAIDKLVLIRANNQDLENHVTYQRINKKAPDNTIIRGKWV